ncbi:MAG: hypothetical protein ABIQ33_11435, partial [Caldimonas sp.]
HGAAMTGQVFAVKGRWLGDDTFEVVSHSVTEGVVTTAAFTFRGREVEAVIAGNQGFSFRLRGQEGER